MAEDYTMDSAKLQEKLWGGQQSARRRGGRLGVGEQGRMGGSRFKVIAAKLI
jgi:hypothetical protein